MDGGWVVNGWWMGGEWMVDGWMSGRMDEWTDGWMGLTNAISLAFCSLILVDDHRLIINEKCSFQDRSARYSILNSLIFET